MWHLIKFYVKHNSCPPALGVLLALEIDGFFSEILSNTAESKIRWRVLSYGLYLCIVHWKPTDVLEEQVASIFSTEE